MVIRAKFSRRSGKTSVSIICSPDLASFPLSKTAPPPQALHVIFLQPPESIAEMLASKSRCRSLTKSVLLVDWTKMRSEATTSDSLPPG